MPEIKLLRIIGLLLICQLSYAQQNAPLFHYNGKTELNLQGKWEFYWNQLVDPKDDTLWNETNTSIVELPAYWKSHGLNEESLPGFGYATYKTTIISDGDHDIGIEFAVPHSAQRIYLNGKLIEETGQVADNEKDEVGLWLPSTVLGKLKKGRNVLTWQLSNHVHARGGVFKVPVIGPAQYMIDLRESQLLMNAFIIGGLFFIGLFFVGMFALWRRDKQFLYYGLYVLFFGFWLSNYGLHIFKIFVAVLEFNLNARLIYVAFYGGFLFLTLFVYETYKETFSKIFLKVSYVVFSFFIATALLTPPHIFTALIAYLQAFGLIVILYSYYIIAKGILRKDKGSILMLVGLLIFGMAKASMFGSFSNWVFRVDSFNLVLYFATFIVFSIVLAQKMGQSFLDVVSLQEEADKQRDEIGRQASKLKALDAFKSRLFANVSHDLRTPLTLILGHIFQIKTEEKYLNHKSKDSLNKLEANAGKLIQLTDEIRNLILLEDDKLKLSYRKVEITSYTKRLVELFHSAANLKNIALKFECEIDQELFIHIDPIQFEKIIYNLMSNALKFTPDKGNIIVKIEAKSHSLQLSVADDGIGIKPDKINYIFNRFYQASEDVHNHQGIGIGLALVLELVELHNGNIHVESEEGAGTKFTVELPFNLDKEVSLVVLDEPTIEVSNEYNSVAFVDLEEDQKIARDAKVVLVVDDHPEIREYISGLIIDDYIVRQAVNGKEALSILTKGKVDAVITDLMMPLLDGFGLIEQMKQREELKRIPVLVVSARTTEEDKMKVLEQGVGDFLAKPFQPEELKLRIVNALGNDQTTPSIWDSLAHDKHKLNSIEENVLAKVNALILSRIDDPKLSVEHIAEVLMASGRKAYNMIKKLTDMNPNDYIKHIKFQYAMDLMKKGKVKSLTEAAKSIGMSNPTHFAKQFEKRMGIHPSEIMK